VLSPPPPHAQSRPQRTPQEIRNEEQRLVRIAVALCVMIGAILLRKLLGWGAGAGEAA
jgi:hypothetical protein